MSAPYGRITNRIITRGLGPHRNRLVTQGYGGPVQAVIAAAERAFEYGRSSARRIQDELKEVIIWARLVSVNDKTPPVKVQGFVRVRVGRVLAAARAAVKFVEKTTSSVWGKVVVTVEMLRRRR